MEAKIRAYVESLFRNTPPSQQAIELREELIQNLFEKYNDFLASGKSEEAAYNVAIASIGDISELLAGLGGAPTVGPIPSPPPPVSQEQKRRNAIVTSVAVCLYILCIIPAIIFDNDWGTAGMFVMIAIATGLLIYNGSFNKRAETPSDTMVGDFQQWRQRNGQKQQIYSVISTVLTVLMLAGYFLISFATGAWYITWLIFLIGGAARKVIKIIVFEVF